ncbi:MAG TPA: hypothetical protein VJ373_04375 [Desulfatiglandales bacterium]|nr:hypothetical protein [Desulfatiglandales bacterium]
MGVIHRNVDKNDGRTIGFISEAVFEVILSQEVAIISLLTLVQVIPEDIIQ